MAIGTTKIVSGIAITGLVGGGIGAGVSLLNNYSTVKSRLTLEGFNTVVADNEWDVILASHNEQQKTNLFALASGEKKDKAWLQKKCEEALNKKSNDEAIYKSARQWCTKTEVIGVILERGKYTVLNTEANQPDKNKEEWNKKLTKLNNNNEAKKKITITWSKEEAEKIKEIKAKCREINAVKNAAQDFDEKFELAKEWCSIKA